MLSSAELSQLTADLVGRHGVAGASVALARGENLICGAGGMANIATGQEATVDTLFQARSVSKMYTATLAMHLVDRGLLQLEAPIVDVIPELRDRANPAIGEITLRHLLEHTSGVDGDFFLDTGRNPDALQIVVDRSGDLDQLFPPGTLCSYSNTGIMWAGRACEVATGLHWDEALRQLILHPMGLGHSHCQHEDILRFRSAIGHVVQDGRLTPVTRWGVYRSIWPAGGVCATAGDVARFGRLHLASGRSSAATELISQQTVDTMQRLAAISANPTDEGAQRGLGWVLYGDAPRMIGHNGGANDNGAFLRVFPDDDVSIAIMTNGGHANRFADEMLARLRESVGLAEPRRDQLAAPGTSAPAGPDAVAGRYRRHGLELDVAADAGGGLSATRSMTETLADILHYPPPLSSGLSPVDGAPGLYDAALGRLGDPVSVSFFRLDRTGVGYAHLQGRATPKISVS